MKAAEDISKQMASGNGEIQTFDELDIVNEPSWLIATNPGGKLSAMPETLRQLRQVERKIVAVSVVGKYRTGKSYLLNRLANTQSKKRGPPKGFKLGSTVISATKGIWIWLRPHEKRKDACLLLMDTEGLGDIEKEDRDHDNWVFLCAALFSSLLVFNGQGSIAESDLDVISFISTMSTRLSAKQHDDASNIEKQEADDKTEKEGDDSNIDYHFPLFIYAIRDFFLELKDERGNDITADQYLERALTPKGGKSQKSKEYDEVRLSIRKYFKTRSCFTFDVPGPREVLQNLEERKEQQKISKEFLADVEKFYTYVIEAAPVKKTPNGQEFNGIIMANLVECCLKNIKSGEVPSIDRILTQAHRSYNSDVCTKAKDIYQEHMSGQLEFPTDLEAIQEVHIMSQQKAIEHYQSNSVFDPSDKSLMELNGYIGKTFTDNCNSNEEISFKECGKVIKKLTEGINANIAKGAYMKAGGFREYQNDMNTLKKEYETHPLGVAKATALVQFEYNQLGASEAVSQVDEQCFKNMVNTNRDMEKMLNELKEQQKRETEELLDMAMRATEENIRRTHADKASKSSQYVQQKSGQIQNLRLEEANRLEREGQHERAEREKQSANQMEKSKNKHWLSKLFMR